MSDDRRNISAEPARRTPGHEQVTERLGHKVALVDLDAEIDLLRREETYHRVGRNAKTLIKRPDFRVVLTAIRGGTRVAEHAAAGPLTVETLRGRIRMRLPGGEVDLDPGRLLTLERNQRHDDQGIEDHRREHSRFRAGQAHHVQHFELRERRAEHRRNDGEVLGYVITNAEGCQRSSCNQHLLPNLNHFDQFRGFRHNCILPLFPADEKNCGDRNGTQAE